MRFNAPLQKVRVLSAFCIKNSLRLIPIALGEGKDPAKRADWCGNLSGRTGKPRDKLGRRIMKLLCCNKENQNLDEKLAEEFLEAVH
jgi:hypothetical protein